MYAQLEIRVIRKSERNKVNEEVPSARQLGIPFPSVVFFNHRFPLAMKMNQRSSPRGNSRSAAHYVNPFFLLLYENVTKSAELGESAITSFSRRGPLKRASRSLFAQKLAHSRRKIALLEISPRACEAFIID